ncbi:unnamed protein product [Candidula unifasciata]|uniref:Histone acetyltransferase n=1 Tax=Candidula unifasciata TaxID=100452 RepID=A0A8S3YIY7_9EUPU|nr:unnamed protein product [Candidula unifasciata]
MASNSKHTEWILETIDHLRRRKARPDLQRICHVVRRRHGLSAVDTETKLEKLVDAEIVIKVDYKGSTSYRNAAKWRKSMLGCAVLNSTTISTKILEAILELSRMFIKEKHEKEVHGGKQEVDTATVENRAREHASDIGISLESINSWLKENCEGFDNLRSPLTVVLKREIDAGRLKRLMSCNYVITSAQMEEIRDSIKPLKSNKKSESRSVDSPSANEESNSGSDGKPAVPADQRSTSAAAPATSSNTPQPARRGRPPKHRPTVLPPQTAGSLPVVTSAVTTTAAGVTTQSKLKRILTSDNPEQTGDGSEQKLPKKMETRKGSSAAAEPACDFCKLTSLSNPRGVPETLLQCKDCTVKAHPSCMNYSNLLASRAYRGPWQCMDCKTCCVCQDAGDPDQMLFCDGCDKGYHMACHNPSVTKKPSGTWECSQCRLENLSLQRTVFMSRQTSHQTVSHESAPPTPAESPVPTNPVSSADPQVASTPCYIGDGRYPDASGWSVNDVVDYLTSAGFREEAKVFREQEIDGVALLLLKRTDVLRGLDLKLGPALKLNRHIQGLQMAHQQETL